MELETPLGGLIGLALVAIISISMSVFSIHSKPNWKEFALLAPQWTKINIGSTVTALIAGVVALFGYYDYIWAYQGLAVLVAGLMGHMFFQSIFTDFQLRLVDRRIFRIANLTAAAGGLAFVLAFSNEQNLILYIALVLVATAFTFIPRIGQSDVRAFQLVLLGTFPIIGIPGFTWSLLLYGAFILAFSIHQLVKKKKFSLSFLLTKVDIPMVPLLLGPTLIILMTFPLLTS